MKAMILAAGFGTRLKPYTDHIPKALIDINGVPMLELLINKLKKYGVKDIIINLHHFAELIIEFLEQRNFGINVELSIEKEILGTGGGIKKAAYFFADGQPFLVHNVDIISNINFDELYQFHIKNKYCVTLPVMSRPTSRYFIVDEQNFVCGHVNTKKKLTRIVRTPVGHSRNTAFSGIHIISPDIFQFMQQEGFFSIVDVYLELIAKGFPIGVYQMDHYYWKDLGRIENVQEVEEDLKNGMVVC